MTSERFLIVGTGLIGGSIARRLKEKGCLVDGIDSDELTLAYGHEEGLLDRSNATHPMSQLIEEATFIILCLYPLSQIDWVKAHKNEMKQHPLVIDVAGVKGACYPQCKQLLTGVADYIATHPMAGREKSGIINSSAQLFHGANLILIEDGADDKAKERVLKLAECLGFGRIIACDAATHDQRIAFLSQLSHILAVSLMNTHPGEDLAVYSGDSFRDLTRIAKINEEMWSELFLLNQSVLLEELKSFQKQLQTFTNALEQGDREAMKEMMQLSTSEREKFDEAK
ncbi:MAG: prephenate dehydrogenase/arogenate dehydrogenase family protein [Erysipelotrichaceae bacterium]|jgi:prephenate dehydrogenase|nr:prephenate dehydrogenase/arogenate dehydrogenase family protein [Erysipelotrichaceae bacterium]